MTGQTPVESRPVEPYWLRELRREFRLALLLISHDFGVVAELCDDVLVLRGGDDIRRCPLRREMRGQVVEHRLEWTASDLCEVEHEGVEGVILGRSIYEGTLNFAEAQTFADEYQA